MAVPGRTATELPQRYLLQSTPQKTSNHPNITLNIKIMKPSTKETIQHCSAVAMLLGGFALAVAGFIVPPTGQIHESVLGIFAECLIYAGSIFGVTIYIQTKYSELRSYLDNKLKDEDRTKHKSKE